MTRYNVSENQTVFSNGKYIAEASTLRLPPGVWPDEIYLTGVNKSHVFYKHEKLQTFGELYGYLYKTVDGLELHVLND